MKKIWILALVYLLSGAVALASAQTHVATNESLSEKQIRISEYSEVNEGSVKLRSLIDFSKSLPESSLYDLELASAPKAGEKIKFTNLAVSQAIGHFIANLKNQKEKTILQSTKILIPKEMTIQGAGWKASIEKLTHVIPLRLAPYCNGECEIVVEEITPPGMKSAYNQKTQFEIINFKSMPKGPFSVEVQVTQNGNLIDKSWVQGKVRVLKQVPVSKRVIVQGERLVASDFEVKKMDVTMELDTTPLVEKLIGAKLKRTLNPNQIILNSALEREKDLIYGQPVQAIVRNADWSISLEAVSRDNGSVGDRVKIYNAQSKKVLSGVLVSKGVVEIQ